MVEVRTCRAFSSALASPQSRRTVEPASLSVKRPSVATSATAPGDPVSKSANPSKSVAGARHASSRARRCDATKPAASSARETSRNAATLGDLREAVTTLEDAERIARRVLGGAHPLTTEYGHNLRTARGVLALREAGKDVVFVKE